MASRRKKSRGVDHGKSYWLVEERKAMDLLKKYRESQINNKLKKDDK
jgi:predicted NAD/FAD-dependent oxidoreductase